MPLSTMPPNVRVYFKSEAELITVQTRATMLSLKVSTYIRDLIMADLYNAKLRESFPIGSAAVDVAVTAPFSKEQAEEIMQATLVQEKSDEEEKKSYEEFVRSL